MIHPVESPHADPSATPPVGATKSVASPVVAAFGAGLTVGALVLLGDALGGVVGMPVKAVRYMLLTTVVLTGLTAAASRRWLHARNSRRLCGAGGVLACALLMVAALAPGVAVFGAALLAAGLPAGCAVDGARRSAPGGRATAWWYAAVLTGLAASGVVCALLPDDPEIALAVCAGVAGALHLPLVLTSGRVRPTPAHVADTASPRPETVIPRALLAGYAGAGFAFVGTTVVLSDLLLFRWTVLGPGVPWRYAGALFAAALVVAVQTALSRHAPLARDAPVLLVAAATGSVLVATAPGSLTAVAGLGVAAGASALAAVRLDARVRALDPNLRCTGPTSWAFLGAVAAVVCRWGMGRALSAQDASVLLATPVALMAVATAYGVRAARGRVSVRVRAPATGVAVVGGAVLVVAALLGPGAVPVAYAGGVPTVEVTATNALSSGQKVSVTGHGFRPGLRAVAVGQCSEGYRGPHQCDLTAGATFVNVDSRGRLPKVVLTMVTSVHGVDCLTRQCVIGVGPLPGSNPRALVDANTVDIRLGFIGGVVQGEARTSIASEKGAATGEPTGPDDTSPLLWSLTVGFLLVCLGAAGWIQRRRPVERSADTA